jgi:hypothetical protein
MAMANGWTPERRARQAALIRNWKPWEQSTGPRSEEGKARASRNGDQGGEWRVERENLRALKAEVAELLRQQRDLLRRVVE